MKKPVIRIYKSEDNYTYVCDFANKIYKENLINIKAIFYVLNMYYILEKDENGMYMQRDVIKPIFDK